MLRAAVRRSAPPLTQRSRLPFVRRVLRPRCPVRRAAAGAVQALVSARRRAPRLRRLGGRGAAPASGRPRRRTATPAAGLRRATLLSQDVVPLVPRSCRSPPPAWRCSALAAGCSAPTPARASCRRCCAACPTTSPPRWTWRSGGWPQDPRGRRRGARAACGTAARPSWPRRSTPASCPPRCSAGSPAFLAATGTAPWRRSTSACPAGPTTPTYILGVLANYLRLRRPGARPRRGVRPGRRRGRGDGPDARRARTRGAAGARLLVRLRAAPRPASSPGCASCRSTTWSTLLAAVRRELARRRGRARRPRAASTPPTTSSSSTSPRRDQALDGADLRQLVAAAPRGLRRRSCAAGTCRGCCSRTAPSPRPQPTLPARRRPAPARHPGVGRHRHRRGARDPRPGRRAPGARARSSWRPPPTRAGRRCSSPPAAW